MRFTQPLSRITGFVILILSNFSVPWLPPLRHLLLQVPLRLCVRARGQRRTRRPVQLRQDPPGLHVLNGPPQHHTVDAHARLDMRLAALLGLSVTYCSVATPA